MFSLIWWLRIRIGSSRHVLSRRSTYLALENVFNNNQVDVLTFRV
jgi:hypothetical protein